MSNAQHCCREYADCFATDNNQHPRKEVSAIENHEKAAYLHRYLSADMETKRLTGELERWSSLAERVTTTKDSGEDHLQVAVEQIIVLKQQLSAQIQQQLALRQEISATIACLPDERLQQLLRLKYISGYRLERVAVELGYDYRWTRRLHKRALSKLTLVSPLKNLI